MGSCSGCGQCLDWSEYRKRIYHTSPNNDKTSLGAEWATGRGFLLLCCEIWELTRGGGWGNDNFACKPIQVIILILYGLYDILALQYLRAKETAIGIIRIIGGTVGKAVPDGSQSANTIIDILDSYCCSVAGVACPSPEREKVPLSGRLVRFCADGICQPRCQDREPSPVLYGLCWISGQDRETSLVIFR